MLPKVKSNVYYALQFLHFSFYQHPFSFPNFSLVSVLRNLVALMGWLGWLY